jgi:hypothetical protein
MKERLMRITRTMRAVGLAAVLTVAAAATLAAQDEVIAPSLHVSFDRPEAWALKYFTSITLMNGLDVRESLPPGAILVGAEVGWVPSLTDAQQRVGFFGTTPNDLNKAPFFVRPRVSVGLPAKFSLTAAGVPPVRSYGVTPRLVSAAIGRPFYEGESWVAGWHGVGQLGTVTGAFTCGTKMVTAGVDSPDNPEGCLAPSSDVAKLRYVGGTIDVGRRAGNGRWTPHASVGLTYMSAVFQTNAVTDEYVDHTRLDTHGLIASGSAGLGVALTRRLGVAADVFYSPLTVHRTVAAPRTIDGAFNARALITYRLR